MSDELSDAKAAAFQLEAAGSENVETQRITFDGLSDDDTRKLEKKLVRKIDFHLILPLFVLFIFNILDRSNIANARLGGLEADLGLTGTQYQTAVSIAFVGYLVGQIPSNIILTRVRPSRYMPVAIFVWGGISICTAAVQNVAGIMVVRVLLGFAESPFFAGALLMISSWYKPSEIAVRVAIMYCGNTVANGFGGLLAAGILNGLHGTSGLAGWRWLYIIEGAGTMVAGCLAYFMLPDFPRTGQKTWLTEQEQRFAEWRLARVANDEIDENGSIKQAAKDAITDPHAWLLVVTQLCLLTSQAWTYFFPSIVSTLGFNTTVTLLITVPVYFFGFFVSFGNALVSTRVNWRAILIIWPGFISIAGNIMVIQSTIVGVRYAGFFLMCAGSYSGFNIIQSWVASTIPRTRTKRAIVIASVNMIGNVSNIYGAYFFPSTDAPQYKTGGTILAVFAAGMIVTASILAWRLRNANKKAAEEESRDGVPRYRYLW